MSLVTLRELMELYPGDFAIGAFNVHTMEDVQAVKAAAEAQESPVILQVGAAVASYAGMKWIATLCRLAAAEASVPVTVHLDHGRTLEVMREALEAGFSSVMIDGSHLPFAENVRLTRETVDLARRYGASVEGELGSIGGVEDDIESLEGRLTDPEQAAAFVEQTGVDALAVAIGNCHGLYKGPVRLDFDRLAAIRARVGAPLVLHGGSDIPDDLVRQAVAGGIRKFNIGTEVKLAFTGAIKEVIAAGGPSADPRDLLGPAREAVRELARHKIQLFGSSGRVKKR